MPVRVIETRKAATNLVVSASVFSTVFFLSHPRFFPLQVFLLALQPRPVRPLGLKKKAVRPFSLRPSVPPCVRPGFQRRARHRLAWRGDARRAAEDARAEPATDLRHGALAGRSAGHHRGSADSGRARPSPRGSLHRREPEVCLSPLFCGRSRTASQKYG